MSSLLKLTRSAFRTNPSATTVSIRNGQRALATTVDAVELPTASTSSNNGPTSTSAFAPTTSAPLGTSSQENAIGQPPSTPLINQLPSSTPPPTPYHPHVHVPLLSNIFPLTSSSSSTTSSEPLLVPLPTPLFNAPSRPSLLHKLIVAHLSSLRAGTSATKNRREVNYSGKKIRPQKGTGHARLGSRGSPMLKGGGHAFGKRPKGPDGWTRKVNRKEERLGLAVGLSEKWRRGDLHIVDRIGLDLISTRRLQTTLSPLNWLNSLFILASPESEVALASSTPAESILRLNDQTRFELSAGNLTDLTLVKEMEQLNLWDVVQKRKIVIELDAVDALIDRIDPEGQYMVGEEFEEAEEGGYEFETEEQQQQEQEVAALEAMEQALQKDQPELKL